MQPFSADDPAYSPYHQNRIHPALTSFADEVCATVARLFAYVGVLALFGILGIQAWNELGVNLAAGPTPEATWRVADHTGPAFALSPSDSSNTLERSDAYVILRHSAGGRKDILSWLGPGEKALAELEIYRPGSEYPSVAAARAELAARMVPGGAVLEAAGVIESKFGSVALLRQAGAKDGPSSCLGFFTRIDDPALQISGWSCQGDSRPTRRTTIACMLDRLTLLTSENEPRLAELFARAELKRGPCASTTASADWVTATENPALRGAF
ncbi:MAG TPA: hypothetical protein VKR55_05035 [Bradyrhizobium sp.]|uniref:hypothetical protein n=1 Tax=Bradyrhizobium sp. TaxID=376 RepID=UPI002CDFF84A|nr:hypothetical protein [Bradyrhizobium sp.]HLZ01501.1 hypothetical protein [Bradyrhizobium sp.]